MLVSDMNISNAEHARCLLAFSWNRWRYYNEHHTLSACDSEHPKGLRAFNVEVPPHFQDSLLQHQAIFWMSVKIYKPWCFNKKMKVLAFNHSSHESLRHRVDTKSTTKMVGWNGLDVCRHSVIQFFDQYSTFPFSPNLLWVTNLDLQIVIKMHRLASSPGYSSSFH